MFALTATLLTLLLGPLLFRLARPLPALLPILDGFIFVGIGGLMLLDILPHSVEVAGFLALAVAALGFFGPTLAERLWHRVGERAHAAALMVALVGILTHSFIDGMALVEGASLSLAVILHRVPVALALWSLIRPGYGTLIASTVLTLMGLSTIGGYFLGHTLADLATRPALGLFEALVAGSLLHVVFHVTTPVPGARPVLRPWPAGIGAIAAVILLLGVLGEGHSHGPHSGDSGTHAGHSHGHHGHSHGHGHDHGHDDHAHGEAAGGMWDIFLSLALKSAPALLLGYIAAGLIHAFLPKGSVLWLGRGSRFRQALKGVGFGLPLPICSCGVLPVYQSLIRQRAPLAASVALLVATPELGIGAVLLSVPLLGVELTIARVVGAGLVAVIIAWALARFVAPRPPADALPAVDEPERLGLGARLRSSLQVGLGELVDSTAPWVLLGLTVAAFAAPYLEAESEWIQAIPPGLDVLIFAFLGMPSYVCASGATPLVAVLVAGGISPGAGIAFLLTGPATNVTTFGILSGLHGGRFAFAFASGMLILSVALGLAVNAWLPTPVLPALQGAHDHAGLLQQICLAGLGLLLIGSILRQGPRGFAGQIIAAHAHPDGTGGHGHGHHHDHGSGGDSCCSEPSEEPAYETR